MWHIPAPEKLKFFIWTTLHESLPTRSLLCHCCIIQMDLCPRCNRYTETILHCLRDCEFAVLFWKSLGFVYHAFYHENVVYEWLCSGIHRAIIYTFLAAYWWLWRAQNSLCLANEVTSPYILKLITVNFANLLAQCFPKSNLTTQIILLGILVFLIFFMLNYWQCIMACDLLGSWKLQTWCVIQIRKQTLI
jgi:hypothetical protein